MIKGTRLTVVNVAYPLAAVSPDAVGGAEQVVSMVDRALTTWGHRSIVLACEGSRVTGELVPIPLPQGTFDDEAKRAAHASMRKALELLLARERVDVVHMHGIDFHAYLPPPGPPVLVTLHLPLSWYPRAALRPQRPRTHLHCVSESQREHYTDASLQLLPDIPNGVSLSRLFPSPAHDDYVLVLGRVCPEKGLHLALEAAHRLDLPLVIAGQVHPYEEHQRYFREQIEPRLDDKRRFVGPVGLADKPRLLARARCLLVPSLVAETSSLSAMEALASGTPVVARRAGALPSIVEHGRTGFLADDIDELTQALANVGTLDRAACRRAAEKRFSGEACAERYLTVYRDLSGIDAIRDQTHRTSELVVRELRSVAELHALVPAWRSLFARCPDATAFQRPEWLLPWCELLLTGEPRVLSMWQGDRLVGLCPFFAYQSANTTTLALMGAAVSDYQNVLLDPEFREDALHALRMELARRTDWQRCQWSELPEHSPLLSLPLGSGTTVTREAQEACPALQLLPDATLQSLLPGKFARDLGYATRRATRDGDIRFERADADSFDTLFAALVRLHGERQAERGDAGVFATRQVLTFHQRAARALLDVDGLRLYGLRFQGELVACLYALHDRDATRYYLSGFSAAHARYSVGTLIVAHAIEEAVREGALYFDFLRGAEAYKYRWGAQDRLRLSRREVWRSTVADPSERERLRTRSSLSAGR